MISRKQSVILPVNGNNRKSVIIRNVVHMRTNHIHRCSLFEECHPLPDIIEIHKKVAFDVNSIKVINGK